MWFANERKRCLSLEALQKDAELARLHAQVGDSAEGERWLEASHTKVEVDKASLSFLKVEKALNLPILPEEKFGKTFNVKAAPAGRVIAWLRRSLSYTVRFRWACGGFE